MKCWSSAKEACRREFDASCFLVNLTNLLTWALVVAVSVHYYAYESRDGTVIGKRIWDQNLAHESAFTVHSDMICIYWIVMSTLQLGHFIYHAYLGTTDPRYTAISLHFAASNVLHVLFLVLFVRSAFGWAELLLLLNFINLSILYFLHHDYSSFTHGAIICGPLAWTFIALYWNGAMAAASVVSHNEEAVKGFGEFLRWGIFGLGAFYVVIFEDFTMGFLLSYLSASIAVAQYFLKHGAQMWISSTVIAAVLSTMALGMAMKCLWVNRMRHVQQNEDEPIEPCAGQEKQETGLCWNENPNSGKLNIV